MTATATLDRQTQDQVDRSNRTDQRREAIGAMMEEARLVPIKEVADRLLLSLTKVSREYVGPCPDCGGDDRFAINPEKGVYNCRSCGGGDVITMVRLAMQVDVVAACEFILGRKVSDQLVDPAVLERRKREVQARKAKQERDAAYFREVARKAAYAIWSQAEQAKGSWVVDYLRLRGLSDPAIAMALASGRIKFVRRCEYRDQKSKEKVKPVLFEGPAMVAVMQYPNNRFGGIHRTWIDLTEPKGRPVLLDAKGKPMPMKLTLGAKNRTAIRLTGTDPNTLPATLIVAEGIETLLSVADEAGAAYGPVALWCAADRGNMGGKPLSRQQPAEPNMDDHDCWACPPRVERLVYLGDDGESNKTTRDALTRGILRHRRNARRDGRDLEGLVAWAGEGADFNDVRREEMMSSHVPAGRRGAL
ncbi:MAG: CHC2 zinc finger domain-containing protein [Pseudomonadota bacterium]